ncbi:unnamed protein product [Durusdinium trenchii]|uniref:Uncharacterized protein n=1 Tax=Durusdinium trenchii TaxID=1381693 RepID=A0ABP0NMK7_9DINO
MRPESRASELELGDLEDSYAHEMLGIRSTPDQLARAMESLAQAERSLVQLDGLSESRSTPPVLLEEALSPPARLTSSSPRSSPEDLPTSPSPLQQHRQQQIPAALFKRGDKFDKNERRRQRRELRARQHPPEQPFFRPPERLQQAISPKRNRSHPQPQQQHYHRSHDYNAGSDGVNVLAPADVDTLLSLCVSHMSVLVLGIYLGGLLKERVRELQAAQAAFEQRQEQSLSTIVEALRKRRQEYKAKVEAKLKQLAEKQAQEQQQFEAAAVLAQQQARAARDRELRHRQQQVLQHIQDFGDIPWPASAAPAPANRHEAA